MTKKKAEDLDALRDRIMLAVLDNVPFDGWTPKAVEHARDMLELGQADIDAAFPNGIPQLLDQMADWADRQALAHMETLDLEAMRVRDRITVAVKARLEALAPHKDAVRRSFALLPRPRYGGQVPQSVWRTADRFWINAGDTAQDYNHYTKRGLLSGVIISSTLFWLNDSSEDHEASWKFLDRRIDNVLTMGKALGRFKPVFQTAEKAASGPRKLARKLSGMAGKGSAAPVSDASTAPGSEAVH